MRCVLYLCSLIVISYAKEYLNKTEVCWEKATKSCKVPEFYMLESSDDTGGGTGFYAWTATTELSSDWTFFKGCIDINIPRGNKQRLSDYFANSNLSFIAVKNNVFQCAFHCTNFKYFVHFMKICLCISSIENYPVIDNTGCVTNCPDDSVFCSSGFGIPLFMYQKDGDVPLAPSYDVHISQLVHYTRVFCDDFDFNERNLCITDLKIVRPTIYFTSHYCVIEKDGYYFEENCYSGTYYLRCDGNDNIDYQTNWVDAVKHCTSLNTKLSTSISNSSSGVWSRYFRYKGFQSKADNKRRKCVAVYINRNKRPNSDSIKWSHYQYRNCSELLPFICVGDNYINSNITSVTRVHINTNATDISTSQIPSNYSEKIEIDVIVKVNIVLLMLSIVMIVLFSVRVCCKKKTDHK